MSNISQKVLKRIKTECIRVTPRWHFLLKNYTIWILCAASILLGGFGVSVFLFLLSSNDWDIYKNLDKSFLEYAIVNLPYVWFAFIGLFLLIAYYNARHIRHGYRYRTFWIAGISVAASVMFGFLLYFAGMGIEIDRIFLDKIPYYNKIVHANDKFWMHPELGLLGGQILEIGTNTTFILRDFMARDWSVLLDEQPLNKGFVRPGNIVKIIGKMQDKNTFIADEIRRWHNSMFRNF